MQTPIPEISTKDFQAKFPGILDKLPLILTKYGKPIAKIESFKERTPVGPKLSEGSKFTEEVKKSTHWTDRVNPKLGRDWNPSFTELCPKHPGSSKSTCGCA